MGCVGALHLHYSGVIMIALLGALQNELSGVAKSMTVESQAAGRPWHISQGKFAGKTILLVRTGMGKDCALSTTEYILENYPVTRMISFGFAGALVAERKVGDVVLCQRLYCESDGSDRAIYSSDAGLLALAAQAMNDREFGPFSGDCLTVEFLTASSEEKHVQGKASGAQVVEMESY